MTEQVPGIITVSLLLSFHHYQCSSVVVPVHSPAHIYDCFLKRPGQRPRDNLLYSVSEEAAGRNRTLVFQQGGRSLGQREDA